jgi:hypothetical protein
MHGFVMTASYAPQSWSRTCLCPVSTSVVDGGPLHPVHIGVTFAMP